MYNIGREHIHGYIAVITPLIKVVRLLKFTFLEAEIVYHIQYHIRESV